MTQHPNYAVLAAQIKVSNLHKETEMSFSKVMSAFHHYKYPNSGEPVSLVSKEVFNVVMANKDRLDGAVLHYRDFKFDYYSFKTLEKNYLLRIDRHIAERLLHCMILLPVIALLKFS